MQNCWLIHQLKIYMLLLYLINYAIMYSCKAVAKGRCRSCFFAFFSPLLKITYELLTEEEKYLG